jgi:hypothetical protein
MRQSRDLNLAPSLFVVVIEVDLCFCIELFVGLKIRGGTTG